MDAFAHFWVNYIEPALQVFMAFMAVMFVLMVIGKMQEGKLADFLHVVFKGTLGILYKFVFSLGLGVWLGFGFAVRVVRVLFSTVRDFFMSRI